jgi:imidazolonepropionase-like amidohydrolase
MAPRGKESDLPKISGERFAIRSMKVLNEAGDWEPATLMVAEGKIVRVAKYDLVSDWRTIDLGNRCVTPGLFSAASTLGVSSLVDPDVQSDAGYVAAADALAGSRKEDRNSR